MIGSAPLTTGLSPTNEYSTVLPLLGVIATSMVKEAIEDCRRHADDNLQNNRKCYILRKHSPVAAAADLERSAIGPRHSATSVAPNPGKPSWQPARWQDIKPGDMFRLRKDEEVPCDAVLLHSSDLHQGVVHVSTSSLDGETSLKPRQAILHVGALVDAAQSLVELSGQLVCDAPCARLSECSGTARILLPCHVDVERTGVANSGYNNSGPTTGFAISAGLRPKHHGSATDSTSLTAIDELPSGMNSRMSKSVKAAAGGDRTVHFSSDNVVLRGSTIRNTEWCLAVAAYTGSDTKIALNSSEAPSKRSQVDEIIDSGVRIVFVLLLGLVLLCGAAYRTWSTMTAEGKQQYLPFLAESASTASRAGQLVTFLILLNNLVPISLSVTLELVKWCQARQIESMENSYNDKESTEGAARLEGMEQCVARTSNLSEDLGRVTHVLTDKTGTLTENMMHMVACSIGGTAYGLASVEEESTDAAISGEFVQDQICASISTAFKSPGIVQKIREDDQTVRSFLQAISLCNTLLPTVCSFAALDSSKNANPSIADPPVSDARQDPSTWYQGTSPDEVALAIGARAMGYGILERQGKTVQVDNWSINSGGSMHRNDPTRWEILATNAFSSTRARMSVLARDKNGGTYLWCKGSDATVLPRVLQSSPDQRGLLRTTQEHANAFASSGLRTLVVAFREVPPDESQIWLESFSAANDLHGDRRKHRLEQLADELEQSLEILGVAAIEDKLQRGVGATIERLRRASCRVWMLTGDKRQTAISVGLSSKLITSSMRRFVIDGKSVDECWEQFAQIRAELRSEKLWTQQSVIKNTAVVVEGRALAHMLESGRANRPRGIALEYSDMPGKKDSEIAGTEQDDTARPSGDTNMAHKDISDPDLELESVHSLETPRHAASNLRANLQLRSPEELSSQSTGADNLLPVARELSQLLESPSVKEKGDIELSVDANRTKDTQASQALHMQIPLSDEDLNSDLASDPSENREGFNQNPNNVDTSVYYDTSPFLYRTWENLESMFGIAWASQFERRAEPEELTKARRLYSLLRRCEAVIACRLTPGQKAQLVGCVRACDETATCVAIGDGGNDVGMIQTAHVGVGIMGVEGRQAVNASDFAIRTFDIVGRLILFHGRQNYKRISLVVLYSFYKNFVLVFTLFLYGFDNGNSGTTLFESFLGTGWNVAFTALPIFVVGVLDEDFVARLCLHLPEVYLPRTCGETFSTKRLISWASNGVAHACICYVVSRFAVLDTMANDGMASGLFLDGVAVNMCIVSVVTMKLLIEVQMHTAYLYGSIVFSASMWLLFVLVYQHMYAWTQVGAFRDFAGIGTRALLTPAVWLNCIAGTALVGALDISLNYMDRQVYPTLAIIAEEAYKLGGAVPPDGLDSSDQLKEKKMGKLVARRGSLIAQDSWVNQAMKEEAPSSISGGDIPLTGPMVPGQQQRAPMRREEQHRNDISILRDATMQRQRADRAAGIRSDSLTAVDQLTGAVTGTPGATEIMSFKSGYWQKYWIPKAIILSRVALFLMCGLSAMYIALEIERNRELSGATKVRLVLLALGIALAIMSFSSLFKSYYTPVVMIATLAGTIGTSLVISDTGVFGQTLFQLGVFLVIRLPFLSQLVCSVVGLAVWVAVASASGLATSSSTANDDAGGIFEFVVYLAFVVAFSALGARNLHNAMYGDYTEQNRLRQEQNAFNDVLGNMLPSHVIKRLEQQSAGLKVWGGLFWEKEPDLSVVFCDIANFDELIDARTPYQLVELLDRVYTLLDVLSVKHGVSKMETVGKTWMGCAGLHGSGENHAAKAVAFGKDALRTVARLRTDEHEQLICLRIGIHTGEAVAGVVGLKKPQFCLFGDTVNTASRMQSTGQTGAVHVSAMTHTAISSLYQFHERQVSVKGKGLMTTYFVGQVLTTGLSDKGSIRQNSTSMIQSTTSSRLGSSNNPTPETDGAFESLLSSLIEVAVGFSQTPLERRYAAEQRTIGAKNAAIAFLFMVLFQVFRLLEIFFISSNERQSVRSVVARAVTLFLCVLSNVLLTMYSASELISFRGRLMFMCSLVAISLAMLSSESIAWRACLDHIFLFAVAAFCGVLSSAESALVNMACAVLFCVASGAPLPWYGLAGGGLPLDYTTAFFCLASVCVVAVSACGEEVYLRRLYKRKLAATRETKRIHAILFKMLPRQIVEQLKEGRKARGQLHSNVTLLFMDVKGFTTISASISPSQVVQLVNSLFSDYDRLSAKHGVFKVQTIGDAYVACAGLPYADAEVDIDFAEESDGDGDQTDSADLTSTEPNTQSRKSKYTEAEVSRLQSSMYGKRSSIRQKFSAMKSRRRYTVTEQPGRRSTIQSARAMLALAQDMHKCSKRIKDPATGKSIQIRVGLHTGTIVAGVIGTKTLRFDIWGPHVIAGNMMESNGIPGQTVVSSYAREYLEGVDGVRFEEHVQVNVRGLGAIETFVAKRAPRASIARDDQSDSGIRIAHDS